jgi:hypothetical protein
MVGVRIMWRFIVMTFIFLGWSFYTLSGGADYQPREGSRQAEALKARAAAEAQVAQTPREPSRAETEAVAVHPSLTNRVEGAATATASATPADSLSPHAPSAPMVQTSVTDTGLANLTLAKPANLPQMAALIPASLNTEAEPEQRPRDLRRITGDSVNMRAGPGTAFGILSRVTRDTEVEVMETFENGWLRIRVLDNNRVGWVSSRLVTPAPARG